MIIIRDLAHGNILRRGYYLTASAIFLASSISFSAEKPTRRFKNYGLKGQYPLTFSYIFKKIKKST
jgi:hypothetical protein